MAGNTTIDIIYRFLADTRQYEQQIKNLGNEVDPAKIKPVDFSQFEKYIGGMKGFNAELNRLVKTQKISKDEAKRLKEEYDYIKKDAAEIARILASTPKGGLREAFNASRTAKTVPSQNPEYYARTTQDAELFQRAYSNTFQHINKKVIDTRTGLKATAADFKAFGQLSREELEKLATTVSKPQRSIRELGKQLSTLLRDFRGFARIGSSLTQIGTTFGIIGAAITGGIWKSATDYIKAIEDGTLKSTETSRQWNKEMQKIKDSSQRIGQVMATQAIPLLETGAQLLSKLANFVEKNPEMASMALKTGIVLTGIGAITAAVGKGITLATDIAFLTAAGEIATGGAEIAAGAAVIDGAADKIVAAGVGANVGGGGVVAGAAGIGLGGAAALTAITAGTAILTDKIFDRIQKRDVKFKDYVTEFKQFLSLGAGGAGWAVKSLAGKTLNGTERFQNLDTSWFKAVATALGLIKEPAKEAANSLSYLSDVLANSAKRDEALKAFEDYKADDLDLLRKYYSDRKKIELDAQSSIIKANQDLANGIAKAYTDQANQISKATADYNAGEAKAEQKYNEDRAKIVADGKEELIKIEQDLQEKLRKLKMDYEERETELLAQRDAVGLVKNRQKYLQDVSEAQRETNKEIGQRRAEAGKKLKELQQEYEQERAQRFEDWKNKIKEIQLATKQEIAELQRKHAEELRQIQIDRNTKLKELDLQLSEDRKRRYNAFIAQIRDLDAALLGEENLRKTYQTAMLKDLDAFLIAYRNGMKSMQTTPPSKQIGGYVSGGLYKLHDGEFVLNPSTTSLLEQMMGAKLTQSSVLQVAGSGRRTNVTWNDSRRFDSRLQASDRRAISEDTINLLSSVVGG